jgi:hypothetical protein
MSTTRARTNQPQELVLLDYVVVLKWVEEQKNKKNELGFFVQLAISRLGENLSSSFVERMNSALKLIRGMGGRCSLRRSSLCWPSFVTTTAPPWST